MTTMSKDVGSYDRRVRRLAKRCGYRLCRERRTGLYHVINQKNWTVIEGARLDLVERWLRDAA